MCAKGVNAPWAKQLFPCCAASKNTERKDAVQHTIGLVCCTASLLFCGYASFFEIFLAHFAQIFGTIQAVKEEDAIEVIYFVLKDTGIPAFGTHAHGFAAHILPLDDHHRSAADVIASVAGDTQAAFGAEFFPLGLDNLRVEERDLVLFILCHEQADGKGDLRSRQ